MDEIEKDRPPSNLLQPLNSNWWGIIRSKLSNIYTRDREEEGGEDKGITESQVSMSLVVEVYL